MSNMPGSTPDWGAIRKSEHQDRGENGKSRRIMDISLLLLLLNVFVITPYVK